MTGPTVIVNGSPGQCWQVVAVTPAGERIYLFDGDAEHGWTVGAEAVAAAMASDPLLIIAIVENDQETLFHRADLWADAFEWYDLAPESVSVTPGTGFGR